MTRTTILVTYTSDFPVTLMAGADYLLNGCASMSHAHFDEQVAAWLDELEVVTLNAMGDFCELADVKGSDPGDEPFMSSDPEDDHRVYIWWEQRAARLVAEAQTAWRTNMLAAIARGLNQLIASAWVPV